VPLLGLSGDDAEQPARVELREVHGAGPDGGLICDFDLARLEPYQRGVKVVRGSKQGSNRSPSSGNGSRYAWSAGLCGWVNSIWAGSAWTNAKVRSKVAALRR
jgi:hypothetical protein